MPISNLGPVTGFWNAVLREFTQSIQAHPILVPKLGDDLTFSKSFKKFINHNIRRYTGQVTRSHGSSSISEYGKKKSTKIEDWSVR